MVNRVLKFTWDEWKWLAVIVMLGVVMYWTAIVVEPTYTLIEEARKTQELIQNNIKFAVGQNQKIIDNQDNNTLMIKDIVNKTETAEQKAREEFFVLQMQHDNTTKKIAENQRLLIHLNLNMSNIRQMLMLQKPEINQTFVDQLIEREMRKWIDNLKQNLTSNLP